MDRNEQIQRVLEKGVSEVLPSKGFVEKELQSGKKLTIYAGFDPTATTLHIGHVIQLRKLRQFQDLGHKIIFLIGDFTARIGDPDKLSVRKPLTEKEIKTNLKLYKKQASKFIRFSGTNAAVVKFNNTWLGKMKFAEVLDLASQMTVDQMLKRDMFVKRHEEGKPIYVHEFMYPLMQGYDSVVMNVDGEVGGNDQLFNMLMGRTLLKQYKNKEKFVITMKLLEDNTGAKMGKTTGNMIALTDTPSDMYGKIMSWTDGMIVPGFELCTDYSMSQVAAIGDELKKGINPRDIKMRLAFEVVKSCTSQHDAQQAEEAFVSTFQKREIAEIEIEKEVKLDKRTLEQVLLDENMISSKSELRRFVEQNSIQFHDQNSNSAGKINQGDLKETPKIGTYKIGKKKFIKIV